MDKKKSPIIDRNFSRFISKIKKRFRISEAILFGSRAKGTAKAYSDFDLILVSESFRDVGWRKRIEDVVKYWESDLDIDVLPYSPEEFLEKKNSRCIVRQAVEEGVIV